MLDVTVIIVTYNAEKFIDDCLSSIFAQTVSTTFEVIVWDNCSSDRTTEVISKRYKEVRLFRAEANVGFSPANNAAMKMALGKWIFLLNPDTSFQSDVIGELLKFLKENPHTGCVGPKIIEKDGSVDLYSAREFPSLLNTLQVGFGLRKAFPHCRCFSKENLPDWGREEARAVPFMVGAALMFSRSLLDQIGFLTEEIPMYFEDLDLCARINRMGKSIWLIPSAQLIHLGGKSSESSGVRPLLYAMENGQAPWLYFKKYGRKCEPLLFTLIILSSGLLRVVTIGSLLILKKFGAGYPDSLKKHYTKAVALVGWALCSNERFIRTVAAAFPSKPGTSLKDLSNHAFES